MKQSIAEKKAGQERRQRIRVLPWLFCVLLAALAFFLKFCIPGYSFSALVCMCLIAIILFYTFIPLVGLKFPDLAKWTTRICTTILAAGLLVVGITEGIILRIGLTYLLGVLLDLGIQGFWYGSVIASYGYAVVVFPYFFSGAWRKRKSVAHE